MVKCNQRSNMTFGRRMLVTAMGVVVLLLSYKNDMLCSISIIFDHLAQSLLI